MNDNARDRDDDRRQEVLGPTDSLNEQTLAVDLARAEIDQQIATAHKYPRSIDVVVKKISTLALYNEEAAQNCIYALPRGGKPIVGPSIGFANVVASAWGNCIDGARIVYVDRKEKKVNAEGLFHDLESNRRVVIPEDRRVVDSKGRLYSDDMIIITGKAAASIARRNAILNAVPRAIWYPIYEQALGIVRGTVGTFAERKDKALKAFAQFGVTPAQLYMALGVKGDPDLTFEHIPSLLGMYQALRDGSTTVEEMFDPRRMTGTAFEQVVDPLRDHAEEMDRKDAGSDTQGQKAPGGEPQGAQGTPGQQQPGGGEPTKAKTAAEKKRDQRARAAQAKDGNKPPDPTPAAAKEAPAPKPAAAAAPAQQPAAPPQQQEPAPQPAAPKTADDYEAHATAYIAAATVAADLENRWKSERSMRANCGVMEDQFSRIYGLYTDKIAVLRGVKA